MGGAELRLTGRRQRLPTKQPRTEPQSIAIRSAAVEVHRKVAVRLTQAVTACNQISKARVCPSVSLAAVAVAVGDRPRCLWRRQSNPLVMAIQRAVAVQVVPVPILMVTAVGAHGESLVVAYQKRTSTSREIAQAKAEAAAREAGYASGYNVGVTDGREQVVTRKSRLWLLPRWRSRNEYRGKDG